MTNYVVDASIVIEYLISGPNTFTVEAFFDRMTPADRLIVPEFCLLECTNVIWKQVRFNKMARADAEELLRDLRALRLRRAPMKRLLDRALDIALNHSLAVYDSGYIALALHYGYPLVTLDRPQTRAASAEGVFLTPLTAQD